MERLPEKINGWTFEETVKSAENLMEAEENMFKWDVLRHLRDFAEWYKGMIAEYEDFEEIFREKMTETACEFLSDKEEFGKWLERNQWIARKCDEYARAEEQGLMVKLPCKVGDTLYDIRQGNVKHRRNDMVHELEVAVVSVKFVPWETWKARDVRLNEIGKTVFLTREEAEQKLKEMERES